MSMGNRTGAKFTIKLRPEDCSEHRSSLIAPHDGKTCTLGAHIGPAHDMYVTDIDVPEGTPDSDYVRGGKLVVMTDKDGILVPARQRARRATT